MLLVGSGQVGVAIGADLEKRRVTQLPANGIRGLFLRKNKAARKMGQGFSGDGVAWTGVEQSCTYLDGRQSAWI